MTAPLSTLELIERIVTLELQQVPIEVLASQMLAPLLEAVDARAGALLCYRRDESALALAAGRGLAAGAAERLAILRWGGAGAWEMPLRALVERKAYVVDALEQRAFVTELVGADDAPKIASLAAIPLHRWHQPVGALLAMGDRPLDPERLLEHRLAYDVLAIALAAALWGGARAPLVDVAATPPPSLVCAAWRDVGTYAAGEGAGVRPGDRGAIDAMLQDLRGAVEALRAERRLEETERAALAERLAAAERERAEHAARTETLERELRRHEAMLNDGGAASSPAAAAAPIATETVAASAAPPTPADAAPSGAPAADAAGTVDPPAPRVLDGDDARREAIIAALARAIPIAPARGLVAVNLYEPSPEALADVASAARSGATIVGYAADATRSRILGGVRCFTDPPAAGEAAAAVEAQPRGGRRMISLSDDIDAFIPAKTELAKLGYSVSMACDDKQAIDLLALLNPDAVLVDLRAAPEAAAGFIDALAPESGRILTLLVHGDPARDALRRAITRLLRPNALEPTDLARVCRGVLASATAGKPGAPVSPIRPVERPEPVKRTAARA